MNISFVHSKGGVTKSAVSTNLSVWLRQKGHDVAAIDLDAGPYGNRTMSTVLSQADPSIPLFHAQSVEELRVLLPNLREKFHFTVTDAPGGFQTTAKTNLELLRHTDFALVPVKPDFDDIEPLTVVEEVIQEARKTNPLLEARVLINCLDRRTRSARQLDDLLDTIRAIAPTVGVMNQTVRVDRNAFQTSRLNGIVVVQGPRSSARDDLNALFSELLADMVVSINRQEQRFVRESSSKELEHEAETVNG